MLEFKYDKAGTSASEIKYQPLVHFRTLLMDFTEK